MCGRAHKSVRSSWRRLAICLSCLVAFLLCPSLRALAADLVVEQLPSMTYTHFSGGVIAENGLLYVWGGAPGYTTPLEIYNPASNVWSLGANLPAGRAGMGEFALNGLIYSLGGEGASAGHFTNTLYRYNPAGNAWTTLNGFPRNTWDTEVSVVGNTAYAFGGRTGYGPTYADVYAYNASTDSWTSNADMLFSVMGEGHTVYEGKIWVFGGTHGYSESNRVNTKMVQIYDPAANTWTQGADMPSLLSLVQAVTFGDSIWVFGGHRYDDTLGWIDNHTAYEFLPASGEWKEHGLSVPSRDLEPYSGVEVIDGYAYFVNFYSGDFSTTEAYRAQLPEPATLSLLALGGLALLRRRRGASS